jgi:hypothetical protein
MTRLDPLSGLRGLFYVLCNQHIGVDDFRLCSSLDCPMHLKKSRSRGTFGWGAGRSRVALAANIGRQGWKMEGEEKRSGPVRTPHFFAVPAKRIQSRAGGIRRPIWLGRGRRSDVVITHRSTLLRAAWPQESNARRSQLFTGTFFCRSHRGTNTPGHACLLQGTSRVCGAAAAATIFWGTEPAPSLSDTMSRPKRGHPSLRTR